MLWSLKQTLLVTHYEEGPRFCRGPSSILLRVLPRVAGCRIRILRLFEPKVIFKGRPSSGTSKGRRLLSAGLHRGKGLSGPKYNQ